MTQRLAEKIKPWLLGLAVSLVFCSGYLYSGTYRKIWQSHYPALAAQWFNDGPFALLNFHGETMEELAYAARVHESAHHWIAFDPYIRENHSIRLLLDDGLTYFLMGFVQRFTHNITRTWLFFRLAAGVLWFVLIYHIMLRLSKSKELAFFAGVFVVCFSYVLTFSFTTNLQLSRPLLGSLARDLWSILSTGRTESLARLPRPGVTYTFLFLATWLEIKAAEDRNWFWGAAAGTLGGVLPAIHPDMWFVQMPAMAFFLALSFFRTNLNRRNLTLAMAVSVVLSAPFLLMHLPFMWGDSAAKADFLLRACVVFTHQPRWQSLLYLAVFGAILYKKTRDATILYLGCFLASGAIVISSQVITGKDILFFQTPFFVNIFLFLLAADWLWKRFKPSPLSLKTAAYACMAIAFFQSMSYAALHFPFQGLKKDYSDALEWLNANSPEDSVVLALNPETNLLIPVYSHDKVEFGSNMVEVSDISYTAFVQRMRASLSFLGADERAFFRDIVNGIPDDRRAAEAREMPEEAYLKMVYFRAMTEEQVSALWEKAVAAGRPEGFGADYVWIGNFEKKYLKQNFPKSSGSHLIEIYKNSSVTLYKTSS